MIRQLGRTIYSFVIPRQSPLTLTDPHVDFHPSNLICPPHRDVLDAESTPVAYISDPSLAAVPQSDHLTSGCGAFPLLHF